MGGRQKIPPTPPRPTPPHPNVLRQSQHLKPYTVTCLSVHTGALDGQVIKVVGGQHVGQGWVVGRQ